jgi:thioredoxin 1
MAEGAAKVTDKDFDAQVSKGKGVVLVDFAASWCPPCKMLGPIIAQVSGEVAGTAKVLSLDVDESRNTAAKFNVMNVPTMIFFKDGKEVQRLIGVSPKEKIVDQLTKLMS